MNVDDSGNGFDDDDDDDEDEDDWIATTAMIAIMIMFVMVRMLKMTPIWCWQSHLTGFADGSCVCGIVLAPSATLRLVLIGAPEPTVVLVHRLEILLLATDTQQLETASFEIHALQRRNC